VRAPIEGKSNDTEDSFYEEPECVLDQFLMKIWVGDFSAKAGREDILKQNKD
jgi:hypothetical protein